MQQIDFKPIGRQVSCLGLGCARIDGRAGLRQATRLLEAALELGVTYFDVAASYGTAEEALGSVIGGSGDVVIATKVGPAPKAYNPTKMWLKSAVKPLVNRVRLLKSLARSAAKRTAAPGRPARHDFSEAAIERSVERSLRRLRRDKLDVLLAHQPDRLDLTPELAARFQSLVDRGLVGAYGVGIDGRDGPWAPFGSIWQAGWPGTQAVEREGPVTRTFHGVLRYSEKDRFGKLRTPAPELIRAARRACPGSVLLVSASTPQRLRELVEASEID